MTELPNVQAFRKLYDLYATQTDVLLDLVGDLIERANTDTQNRELLADIAQRILVALDRDRETINEIFSSFEQA